MPAGQYQDWSRGFVDYLFVAFTNATAFSPTDTRFYIMRIAFRREGHTAQRQS